jgi:hypothetical protein
VLFKEEMKMKRLYTTAFISVKVLCVIILLAGCQSLPPEPAGIPSEYSETGGDLDGKWTGSVKAVGVEYKISVVFTSKPVLAGIIDIPEQGKEGVKLVNIRFEPPKVYFEIEIDTGNAKFEGTLSDKGIKGRFTQGPLKGTFSLVLTG